MRIDLPALIVGCGPSAVHVPRRDDRYTVHAVNDAIRLCEHADTLAINDTPALLRMTAEDIAKVGTLVLPEHLHDNVVPSSFTPAEDALGLVMTKIGAMRPAGCLVSTYRLHTDPLVTIGHHKASFGFCRSTSDSLIAWLLAQGVREFRTLGIEWDGRDGWAAGLPRGHSKTQEHRRAIWQHTLKRIENAGGTVARWVP